MRSGSDIATKIMSAVEVLEPTDKEAIRKVVMGVAQAPSVEAADTFRGWLEKISVQGVRAFGQQEIFELSRGLTIIYAQNGSGKTSLVDAIELLSTGRTTRAAQYPQLESEMRDDLHVQHATLDGEPCAPDAKVSAVWRIARGTATINSEWSRTWGKAAENAPPVHLIARRRLREVIALKGPDRASRLGDALGLSAIIEEWTIAQNRLSDEAKRLELAPVLPQEFEHDVVRLMAATPGDASESFLEALIVQDAQSVLDSEPDGNAPAEGPWDVTLGRTVSPLPKVPPTFALEEIIKSSEDLVEPPPQATRAVIGTQLVDLFQAFLATAEPNKLCPACEDGTVSSERLSHLESLLHDVTELRRYQAAQKAVHSRATALLDALPIEGLRWSIPLVSPQMLDEPAASEKGVGDGRKLSHCDG
ncbi:hypothetical protein StoSoilB5_18530 [Arthrobacter sp. StoSoilB5]|nr:hypothetical protein StoSoilB5_18530 [Arthrobacter sp. StoSoilB5]